MFLGCEGNLQGGPVAVSATKCGSFIDKFIRWGSINEFGAWSDSFLWFGWVTNCTSLNAPYKCIVLFSFFMEIAQNFTFFICCGIWLCSFSWNQFPWYNGLLPKSFLPCQKSHVEQFHITQFFSIYFVWFCCKHWFHGNWIRRHWKWKFWTLPEETEKKHDATIKHTASVCCSFSHHSRALICRAFLLLLFFFFFQNAHKKSIWWGRQEWEVELLMVFGGLEN